MIINYKGMPVNLHVKKLLTAPPSVIWKFFKEQADYKKMRIKNYWLGYVEINKQDIMCDLNDQGIGLGNKIYELCIYVGRKNKGQSFSINKQICEDIIEKWEHDNDKTSYSFHLDLGNGFYQDYIFTKRMKNELIKKLKPFMKEEWYDDNIS